MAVVELDAMKNYLRVDSDEDDSLIEDLIDNAQKSCMDIARLDGEDTKEVQTETLTIKATPLADGMVKAKTGNETDSTVYDAWYDAVYLPTVTEDSSEEDSSDSDTTDTTDSSDEDITGDSTEET